jgi:dTDP-4-dehydrorhamnose reductase
MKEINKIILFGYTGMLGNYIYNYFKDKIKTIPVNFRIENNIDIDLLENILLENKIDENSLIINCIGQIPQRKCKDTNDKVYFIVNSVFPNILYTICKKYSSKMIQPTTDCVFTGKRENGMYNEKDTHDENNSYGISKSIGEPFDCTVIRTSIIGLEKNNKKSLMEWILNSLKNNITIEGWENHLWNGITCLEYCKVIEYMIENNYFWKGVKHIYSPTPKSKYEISCVISDVFGYDKKLIIKTNTKETINKTLSSICDFPYKIQELDIQIEELFSLKK